MSKNLLFLLVLLLLPFNNVKSVNAFYLEPDFFIQDDQYFLHTVERGQTVYSISVMYRVTVDDIHRLNPQSKAVIRVGEALKIPQVSGSYIYHTIQPQETLYGVSQKYQIKGEYIIAANPGLSTQTFSIGKIIRIPVNLVSQPAQGGNDLLNRSRINSLLSQTYTPKEVNMINVALLLPFGLKENAATTKDTREKMTEYMEGFLMALKSVKKDKISVHLQIYDIGTGLGEIPAILNKTEMQDVHLLIGGLSDEQIKLLSQFANEKEIPYLIPLASQTNEPLYNSNVYQINTPHSHLYSKASLAFINKYGRDNIIIVSDNASSSNQKDFIEILKRDLQEKKIQFKTVTMGGNFNNDINILLNKVGRNVIVPSDDTSETLSRLVAPLKSLLDNQPGLSISLFGYPDWQAHSAKYSDDFFRLNTSFYSNFFSNPTSSETKLFHSNFYRNYSRVLGNNFPKFGMLGYDTGMYFIRLINAYGVHFSSKVNNLNYNGIQTDFNFERVNNWSGFINMNLYFINYNPDYTMTKNIIK